MDRPPLTTEEAILELQLEALRLEFPVGCRVRIDFHTKRPLYATVQENSFRIGAMGTRLYFYTKGDMGWHVHRIRRISNAKHLEPETE